MNIVPIFKPILDGDFEQSHTFPNEYAGTESYRDVRITLSDLIVSNDSNQIKFLLSGVRTIEYTYFYELIQKNVEVRISVDYFQLLEWNGNLERDLESPLDRFSTKYIADPGSLVHLYPEINSSLDSSRNKSYPYIRSFTLDQHALDLNEIPNEVLSKIELSIQDHIDNCHRGSYIPYSEYDLEEILSEI